eukprot:XP_008179017.1 PREDICTED: RNA-directed DNA polymerase from mobile element jockey-like [Acyrthosiphon pisum]
MNFHGPITYQTGLDVETIIAAIWRIRATSAPGADRITAAQLVIIPKPGIDDPGTVKSYRPTSLLPVLGKALESMVIQEILIETNLDSHSEQHRFTTGKSTISAVESVYDWVGASKCRHTYGTFIDITGAFDYVRWSPLLVQLEHLGASIGTLRVVHSYLENRRERESPFDWPDGPASGTRTHRNLRGLGYWRF